ncbi:MAG TPA: twin-arginine translocation signal domain-containing protein, partial [Verrucomicrobiae bacterium]|nr:twin-arginine translocation signal domain-containing protein [Verrucomicrobiae bacterium]
MKQPGDRSRRRFLKASSALGLAVAFNPRAVGEAFADSKSKTTLTQTRATRASEQAADRNAIRPFQVNIPEAELTDLRRRINATRWPER